jgi:hypothetical protein
MLSARALALTFAMRFPSFNNPPWSRPGGVIEAGKSLLKYTLPGKRYFARELPASITPPGHDQGGLSRQGNRQAQTNNLLTQVRSALRSPGSLFGAGLLALNRDFLDKLVHELENVFSQ